LAAAHFVGTRPVRSVAAAITTCATLTVRCGVTAGTQGRSGDRPQHSAVFVAVRGGETHILPVTRDRRDPLARIQVSKAFQKRPAENEGLSATCSTSFAAAERRVGSRRANRCRIDWLSSSKRACMRTSAWRIAADEPLAPKIAQIRGSRQ
jgi:hypothetical protein